MAWRSFIGVTFWAFCHITIACTHFHTGIWRVSSARSLTWVSGVWLSALPDFKKITSPKTNLSFLVNSSIFKYNLLSWVPQSFFFNDYQRDLETSGRPCFPESAFSPTEQLPSNGGTCTHSPPFTNCLSFRADLQPGLMGHLELWFSLTALYP